MATIEKRVTPARTVTDRRTGKDKRLPAMTRFDVRWRDGEGASRRKTFTREAEAKVFKKQLESAADTGLRTDSGASRLTLRAYMAEQYAPARPWTSRTQALHDYTVRTLGALADRPLRSLTRSDVAGWVKRLGEDGMAPSTIRAHLTRLRGILNGAVEDDLLVKSPARGDMPVQPRPKVEGRADPEKIPSVAQVRDLLDELPERYRIFGVLTAFCGLRSGEARGLRVGDVDPLHNRLSVRGQLVRERGGMSGGPEVWAKAKTDAGERTITLDPALMAEIAEHIRTFTGGGAGEYLLTTGTGAPLDTNTMGNAFRRARARVGLGEHITPHSLRHFAGSHAMAAPDARVADVQRFLGHSSPRVTLDVYTHRTDGAQERVAAGMGAVFAAVAASS